MLEKSLAGDEYLPSLTACMRMSPRDAVIDDRFMVVSEELNRIGAVTLHDVRSRLGCDFVDIFLSM